MIPKFQCDRDLSSRRVESAEAPVVPVLSDQKRGPRAREFWGRLNRRYVSRHEYALVDTRLYLPKEWATDKSRRKKAGVPKAVRYRTRHRLCLEMLKEQGEKLPHTWIAGDDEMGRPSWFRRRLDAWHERYLLAVPSNTLVRDLEVDPPASCGRGRKPARPWVAVNEWAASRTDDEWIEIEVRDGAKGPLVVEVLKRRVTARTEQRQAGPAEVLVVIRYHDRDRRQVVKTDYYLSNAQPQTTLAEFARVAKAEHRIEECLQRAKSEAGLADYEVRNWRGWHHHRVLSLIASWFLVTEARRGKKMDTCDHGSADPGRHLVHPASRLRMRYALPIPARARVPPETQPTGSPVPLEAA